MQTLFISDIHLSEKSSEITACFLSFLREVMADHQTQALYILGDLFEVWAGDDDCSPWLEEICSELKKLSEKNIKLYFMHGNRDFLLGKQWAEKCCAILLPDPVLIDLYHRPMLLTHGDLLCTGDRNYQRWRKFSRLRFMQKIFLKLPLKWRQRIARGLRKESRKYTQHLASEKMDVNLSSIETWLKQYSAKYIIHGHTHRPAIHQTSTYTRYVLPDWHPQGGMLVVKPDKIPELMIKSNPQEFE